MGTVSFTPLDALMVIDYLDAAATAVPQASTVTPQATAAVPQAVAAAQQSSSISTEAVAFALSAASPGTSSSTHPQTVDAVFGIYDDRID